MPSPQCGAPFPSVASGSGSQRLARPLPGAARLFTPRRQAQAARGPAHFPRMQHTFSVRSQRLRQPEACRHSPRVWRAFSLRGPSAHRRSGLRKSLARTRGPVCSLGGGGFSGAEFAPFPSPLPPSSSRDGPALPWSFSVPLFCEPPAVCYSRLIFSLAIPQFKKAPSRKEEKKKEKKKKIKKLPPTALRAFWPVLTLSNAARSSLFCPHLLVVCVGIWGTFLLGVAFRHVICGPYLIFPPS